MRENRVFFLAVSIECAVGFETLGQKNAQLRQDTCKQQSPARFSKAVVWLCLFGNPVPNSLSSTTRMCTWL